MLETGEFLAPSVPVKEEADRISFKTLRTRLSELEKRVAELELARESATTEVKQTKPADGDVENDETIVAITNEVFRRLLEPGEYVHLTHIYHTLASVHLQLQPGKFQTWPADWKEQLTGMLKVSGKMSVWVKDICPVPIEFSTEEKPRQKSVKWGPIRPRKLHLQRAEAAPSWPERSRCSCRSRPSPRRPAVPICG